MRGQLRSSTGFTLVLLSSLGMLAACSGNGGSIFQGGPLTLSVGEAVARDANGAAVNLGQTVITEGVATVSAGVLANNKLKIFLQDGMDGIMLYDQSSAEVPAFQAGDRVRATGVIRQQDPTSDNNPANGTILVDITPPGSWVLVSSGNSVPAPQAVTLSELEPHGDTYVGTLVSVANVQKVAGDWPAVGSKSAQVMISDDDGATQLVLRLQKNTIDQDTVDKVTAIGDGPFTVTGIVVQDDPVTDGTFFHGYEIWIRGAGDVIQ